MHLALALTLLGPPELEAPRMVEPVIVPAPNMAGPSCSTDDSLSLTGNNLWEGLSGKPILVMLEDGSELQGSVVEQSSDQLAFARASDGQLVAVPKRDVTSIRLRPTSLADDGPRRAGLSDDGRKQSAAGAVLLTFGSIFALSGTVMLGICPSCLYIHLPLLLPGAALIGGGVGLVKAGKRKKAAYERSWGIARARLTPSFAVGRSGGNVGLTLRF